jgi:Leucine-rich repeat (LRR) protein
MTIQRKNYPVLFIIFCCIFCGFKSNAQTALLDSLSLDTLKAYTSIEEAMKQPERVIKLALKRDKLKAIPAEVFTFINLQYLDLSKNNITIIPSEIKQLKNLQYLSLEKNKLESLPPEIGELNNLFYLNVGQNDLLAIPPEIGKLEKLRYLDAWFNNLSVFPDELVNLKSLKKFDLNSIIISDKEKKRIQSLLPNTKIHFANGCGCLN